MTSWDVRVAVAVVTLIGGSVFALGDGDRLGAFLLAFAAGAAGMRLLYLFDPTVNR